MTPAGYRRNGIIAMAIGVAVIVLGLWLQFGADLFSNLPGSGRGHRGTSVSRMLFPWLVVAGGTTLAYIGLDLFRTWRHAPPVVRPGEEHDR